MEEDFHNNSFTPELTGRLMEMDKLKMVWNNTRKGEGSTIFISGEAGVGKTRLVTELFKLIDSAQVIKGWCLTDSLEPLMPYKEALRDADLYHLIAESAPPKVMSAYLINDSGLLITKKEREDSDLDPDIFASMLTAVGNFVDDSLVMMGNKGESELNAIGYGRFQILIQTLGNLSLAAVIEGSNSEFLIDDMRGTLLGFGDKLESWDGNVKRAEEIAPKISWFVDSGKYEGKYLVDDPKIKQENLFDNVLMGIQRLSSDQPVILFLDDIQWADHSSLKLLHYLARNTREYKVMIICTYRPEDVMRLDDEKTHPLKTTMQNMSREGLFEEIKLERLDESTVKEFIKRTLGELDINDEFVKKIYGECEGNPFFLLEVIQMLVGEGYLTEENGLWSAEGTTDDIHIPSKIYDVVVRRLDRLIGEQRDLLECASVVGDEFESGVVGEMAGINRIKLLKNLNDIERTHNLIHSVKKKYRFDHNKIREVLYTSINQELREEYHRVVAESYERLYSDTMDEALVHIAHHYYNAGDERGVEYLLDAGDKAVERYANEEGVIFYSNALSLMEDDTEYSKRAFENLGDIYAVLGEYDRATYYYNNAFEIAEKDKNKAALHGKIAKVYEETGGYEESLEHIKRGLSLVDVNGIELCRLLSNKGWMYIRQGEFDKAIKVFKKGMDHVVKFDKAKETGQALHDLGTVYIYKADYDEAEDYLRKAIAIREKNEDLKGLSKSYNNIGLIHWKKGDTDKALEYYMRSLDIDEKVGDKSGIATSLHNIGTVYSNIGQLERAMEYYKRSLHIKRETGSKSGIADGLNNIGNIYRNIGALDKALEHHKQSLGIREEIGDKMGISLSLYNIGGVHRDKGEISRALEYYENSLKIREEIGDRSGVASSLHKIGRTYSDKGEIERALDCYERCLKIRREIGDKQGMIVTLCGVAETSIDKGDIETSEKYAEKALNLTMDIGGKAEEILCRRVLAMVYRENRKWEESIKEFRKGIRMSKDMDDERELCITYYEFGLMWKARGEVEKAVGYLEKAFSFFKETGMKLWAERMRASLEI